MNERMRKLRKALDLTQKEFAERIGIKQNTIATYEIGRSEPIDAVVSLICREFNVSETWLRTGDGEMFEPEKVDAWEEVVKRRGLSDSDRLLIEKFMCLKPAERDVVMKYVLSVAADYNAASATGQDIPVPATPEPPAPVDLAAKVAELERQNQELTAKVAAMEEEDAGMEAAAELSAWPSVSAGSLSPVEKAKK